MRFKDKVAIVSGAARGIGRAIALSMAREGASVSFNYLHSNHMAESLVNEITAMKGRALSFQCDIRDEQKVAEWVEKTKEQFGKIDILVNNAGIIKDGALAMMKSNQWTEVMETNLNGVFFLTRAVLTTLMRQQSGNIINITSISGITGLDRQTNYSASKAGIIGFTKSLAKEVAPFHIRVNAVAPGFIETDMVNNLSEKFLTGSKKQIPLKRFGTVEEVAKVVSFLASDDSSYITGEVIKVDGGLAV